MTPASVSHQFALKATTAAPKPYILDGKKRGWGYTHGDGFVVGFVDESVEEDANALVAPDAQKLVDLVEPVGRRHRETVVDSRQIAQVEDVVKLGRRCRQLVYDRPVFHAD